MKRWMRRLVRTGAACLALLCLALLAVYRVPVHPTVQPLRARADTQYWRMPGGYRIAYTKRAPPPGVARAMPVVFLHGGPGGGASFV
jgi:proline iminopeptidase